MRITVFGAGAWGTALASHMAKVHDVLLWGRDAQVIQSVQLHHQNPRYLPSMTLCPQLQATTDFRRAVQHASVNANTEALWVLGVPMSAVRPLLQQLLGVYAASDWPKLVWLCKGFEEDTALMPHQVVESVLGIALGGALTGPSFAAEVAQGLPCALTAASADAATRDVLVQAMHHGAVRVYGLEDLVGAEVGGAMKNVMALATGLSDGLQLGLNARAALVTRGLSEMKRLALALGAKTETLNGLSGLGDLLLTATGDLSRNRRVGLMLAQGKPLSKILLELGQVAEGVKCAAVVVPLAKRLMVDMPITNMVNAVLFEGMSPQEAVTQLLAREAKSESV